MEDDHRRQLAVLHLTVAIKERIGVAVGSWRKTRLFLIAGLPSAAAQRGHQKYIYSWRRGNGDSMGAEKLSECLDKPWPGPGLGYTPDRGG